MKRLFASLALIAFLPQSAALATTIGLAAIEDYSGIDPSQTNCPGMRGEVDSTAARASQAGWTVSWKKYDTDVQNTIFTDVAGRGFYTGVNFLWYGGHGDTTGPALGWKNDYNWENNYHIMKPEHYHWGFQPSNTKWVATHSCLWFYNDDTTGNTWDNGTYPLNRWKRPFERVQLTNQYNGSLHAIFANAADSYSWYWNSVGEMFLDNALRTTNRYNSGYAWMDANYWEGYINVFQSGIIPAIMYTIIYTGTQWRYYTDENLASPWPDPTAYPASNVYLSYTKQVYGTPKYWTKK